MKITPRKYAEALLQALDESKNPAVTISNFLSLLRRRKQFKFLPKVVSAFESAWRRKNGVLKMEVSYPSKFEGAAEEFGKIIGQKLGKEIQLQAKASPTMIGGLRVRLEDKLIDASLEGRLAALALTLKN